MSQVELLDPTARPIPRVGTLADRPPSLEAGMRVGLLDNSKANADILLERVAQRLRATYGVHTFVQRRKPTATRGAEFLEEFGRAVEVVVNALGD